MRLMWRVTVGNAASDPQATITPTKLTHFACLDVRVCIVVVMMCRSGWGERYGTERQHG